MKTRINVSKLTNFDLPESCYILGFLWGDGYIHWKNKSIQIEILHKDYDNLKKIFESIGPWTITYRTRKNRQPQARIQFNSIDTCKFLYQYNYQNKSISSPIILQDIPISNQHYFIRGLSDADGSFYHNTKLHTNQFTLSGSYNQDWSDITCILDKLHLNYRVLNRTHSTKPHKNSIIRITGIKNINNLGEYIYSNKIFGLKRKINKYKQILSNSIRIPVESVFNI